MQQLCLEWSAIMKLFFDELNNKDMIGKAISLMANKKIKSFCIVSPYISKINELIDLSNTNRIQIICNARSNSCNPFTLNELSQKRNIQIKTRNDIHAKVYLLDNTAFITSANATPNGLSTGTIEAAVEITDLNSIKKIQSWFHSLWNDLRSEDIANFSDETWRKLQSNWVLATKKNNDKPSLYDLMVTESIPENVAFAFWNENGKAPEKSKVAQHAEGDNVLLSLYRTDNVNYGFTVDTKSIELINTDYNGFGGGCSLDIANALKIIACSYLKLSFSSTLKFKSFLLLGCRVNDFSRL
jgi:hypothetical protein